MKLKIFVFLFFLFSFSAYSQIAVGYINGYYSQYPPSAIDFNNLNYINMSFIYPQAGGGISVDSWFLYPDLVTAAHAHKVKVIVSVGGYGGSDGFGPMAADTAARHKFVNNLVNFCKTNNFDGADLDWEYPSSSDRNYLTALVSDIRQAFNKAGISTLTMAITSSDWSNAYDIANLKNNLDWFGVMTYDFYGPWETASGNDAALYSSPQQQASADNSVKYYLNRGVPANKLCIGMPFGGYLLNSKALHAANSGGSSVSYLDAAAKLQQGWEFHWDDVCKQPYLQNSTHTQLITYDDTTSIKLKCEYIRRNKLKGTIIWKIGRDYNGSSSPLLDMIGKYLLRYPSGVPASPVPVSPADGSKDDSTAVTLKWISPDSCTSYGFQFSDKSDFSVVLGERFGLDLPYFNLSGLKNGTTYYWRADASNLNGTSSWSDVYAFTTKESVSGIKRNSTQTPREYFLSNYPNPFNPSTVIEYRLAKASFVKLDIYNILGSKISSLINKEQPAGVHQIIFDAQRTGGRQLCSGVYICVLRAGSYTLTRKLQLIK